MTASLCASSPAHIPRSPRPYRAADQAVPKPTPLADEQQASAPPGPGNHAGVLILRGAGIHRTEDVGSQVETRSGYIFHARLLSVAARGRTRERAGPRRRRAAGAGPLEPSLPTSAAVCGSPTTAYVSLRRAIKRHYGLGVVILRRCIYSGAPPHVVSANRHGRTRLCRSRLTVPPLPGTAPAAARTDPGGCRSTASSSPRAAVTG